MKKLMIGAAVAAIAAGAFASCSDTSTSGKCVAWDLSLTLKSLDAKKLSCKSACGDKSSMYYLDNTTRKLKGYLWACEYSCEDASGLYVVLWDTKKKIPVIPAPPTGVYDFATVPVAFADWMVYGKKANKVAGEFLIEDDRGDSDIQVTVAGLNGSVKYGGCSDCYIKSLSGNAAGMIKIGAQYGTVDYVAGGLCGEPVEVCSDDDALIYYVTLCDICCGFDGWCSDGAVQELADNMVPAYGTWKMKYNKKMSSHSDTKAIWSYVPGYAL